MRIALPHCNSSVSPVLDTAEKFIVVEVDNGVVTSKHEIILTGAGPQEKAKTIANHADVLVCGAISRTMCIYLDSLGVIVHPWTMGNIEPIIEIVSAGNIPGLSRRCPAAGEAVTGDAGGIRAFMQVNHRKLDPETVL